MNRELKAYRERKRILEVLGLDECDMEQVYRALGRDEESIQGMKDVTRALDNRLLAWELCRKRLWWQLAGAGGGYRSRAMMLTSKAATAMAVEIQNLPEARRVLRSSSRADTPRRVIW